MNTWTTERERGSARLLRGACWLTLTFGWGMGRLLLYPGTLYYYATAARPRAASRDYLRRVLGRPVREAEILRHFFNFASITLDRVFLLSGRTGRFTITTEGLDALTEVIDRGEGCILLGSHLGSFEALRAFGRSAPVRVSPVMHQRPGSPMAGLMQALDPALAQDVIAIGSPDAMLQVKASLARGEIVAFLADRDPQNRAGRTVSVDFLGEPAEFPTGPFILAAVLEAPVVLFYGLRLGPRRYSIRFERFAERIILNRATRQADLVAQVSRYSASLAAQCQFAPFNWFNFFPFWNSTPR
jgi:predicted LPLAT superfamily acyltransferase